MLNVSCWRIGRAYFIVLFFCAALYVWTCAPGVLWQDSGMYQYRIWHNDIKGGLGLALAHPLYHLIGIAFKHIPVGDFGFRVNLVSAAAGAAAAANVFLLLRLWIGENVGAVIGAISLALSWTFWQHCCIAEVYTLYAAFFTAEVIFLFCYFKSKRICWLYWLGLFNGLAIAVHMWGVIPLGCYVVMMVWLLIKRKVRIGQAAMVVLLWVIGAASYEYLIIREMLDSGDVLGTLSSALFGNGWGGDVLNVSLSKRLVLENLLFLGYNFPSPNIILIFAGLFGLYKSGVNRAFANLFAAMIVLFYIFAFRYTVPDRYAFFIPFYCLAAVCIGVGAHLLLKRFKGSIAVAGLMIVFAVLPVLVYWYFPQMAEHNELNLGTKRSIPYRNDYTYFLRPWQGRNYGPERFAREALEGVEDDAVIIADSTTLYTLWYCQAFKSRKSGVKIVSEHGEYQSPIPVPKEEDISSLLDERAVYVVSPVSGYCPEFLIGRYNFDRSGVLWRIVKRD